MVESSLLAVYQDDLELEHRKWLSHFEPSFLSKWDTGLKDSREPALAEAGVRRFLQRYGIVVEPNDPPRMGGLDFFCWRANCKFYVEVTCIQMSTASDKMQLISPTPLNKALCDKCRDKWSQFNTADAPALLAIGTFDRSVAFSSFRKERLDWLLTGEQTTGWERHPYNQIPELCKYTDLRSAAFLRHDEHRGDIGGHHPGNNACDERFFSPHGLGRSPGPA